MGETYKTGGDCDAWCTKCRMDLAHTIVAMVGGTPVQVKCNTCGGFHRYRPPKSGGGVPARRSTRASARGASSGRSRKPATPPPPPVAEAYRAAMQGASDAEPRPYLVTAELAVGDKVDHPRFGLGIVVQEIAWNRAKVLFRDAERTLLMRHGAKR